MARENMGTYYVVNSAVLALEGAIFPEWQSVAKVLYLYTRPDKTVQGDTAPKVLYSADIKLKVAI